MRGEKRPSSGKSGPSGTMNRLEWSICFSLLPPLADLEGSPLNTFLDLSSLACGLKHCSCNNKAVVVVEIVQH